ncbi:MAG: amino acid ABC transporter permease [Pseudomonadota bacterium]
MVEAFVRKESHPDLPPPVNTTGPVAWVKENLFRGPVNTILTLISLYIIYWCIAFIADWAVLGATLFGSSTADCTGDGACWAMITTRIRQLIFGFYPPDQIWRVVLGFAILFSAIVPILFDVGYRKQALITLLFMPFIGGWLFYGGLGLEVVPTSQWGGIMITLVVSMSGILLSLPIGIVLALGRRSHMPIVRVLCVTFIEIIRGVPLISLLFMGSTMFNLFMPDGVTLDKLLRALLAVVLFASAYMAEVVRGGLQALPKGQYEGAAAMGLGYWQMTRLIVLPQALKNVIPAIVNTFIGLAKDTTLVSVIGIFDVLGIVNAITKDSAWLGTVYEGFAFVAVFFFIFCFGMSRYSMHLEKKLHTGHKR